MIAWLSAWRRPPTWLPALLLLSCLRPMQERAERDLEVGTATHGELQLRVEHGLAAVQRLDQAGALLWASAPSWVLHIQPGSDAASDEWELRVHNAMPGTQLERLDGDVEILSEQWLTETRVRWLLRLPSEADARVSMRIAPPGSDAATPFRFAVMSDVQEAIGRVQDVFARMNDEPDIEFVLGAGDLTQQGARNELARFQRELEALRLPYYTTLGNHELGETPAPWHDYFGRGNFHFVYRSTHFSMLDSGSAAIDPQVYGWLEGWLAEGRDGVHIVATHIPPVDPIGVRNGSFASRNEAAKLLAMLAEGRVDLTIYGHIHSYYAYRNAGIEAHISGGGGAIPEKFDGMGRHFLVVEVDPQRSIRGTQIVQVDR